MNRLHVFPVVVSLLLALPIEARGARSSGKAEPAVRESGRIERPLAERFREKLPEAAPGSKAAATLKGNGVEFDPMAAKVESIYRAEGLELKIPKTMTNDQGLRLSVNRAIVDDAVKEAQRAKESETRITEVRETYQGRTVTAMLRELNQAKESLDLARQLGSKDRADSDLLSKAEEMVREGMKLFNVAMSRYNEVAATSRTRDPLRDQSIAPLLSQLARMMSFSSARLREVLEESLREGDIAALSGFATRAREFADAAGRASVTNPMQEAFLNILRQQGLEFANRDEALREADRLVDQQRRFCQ